MNERIEVLRRLQSIDTQLKRVEVINLQSYDDPKRTKSKKSRTTKITEKQRPQKNRC